MNSRATPPEKTAPRGWRVAAATFETSAPKLGAAPAGDLPEIAVTGRSNVGKSSLLNAFAGQRGLARVSRTPGRTQLLNFFKVSLRHPRRGDLALRWCDLPGYGYAAAPGSVRASFGPMIEGYLRGREALAGLIVLIDSRREISDYDLALLDFMRDRALWTLVCATKVDKLSKAERGTLIAQLARQLEIPRADVVLTSAQTGFGLGDDGLTRAIADRLLPREVQQVPVRPPDEAPPGA